MIPNIGVNYWTGRNRLVAIAFLILLCLALACSDDALDSTRSPDNVDLNSRSLGRLPPTQPPTPPSQSLPSTDPNKISNVCVNPGSCTRIIKITGLEITQGIQNLSNSMPLVEGRETYARVYLEHADLEASIVLDDKENVTGELCAFKGGIQIGSCVFPENGPITALADGGDRINLHDSLYFWVPPDWRLGTVTFKATVWTDDLDYGLYSSEVELGFLPVKKLNVHLVPLHLHQTNPHYWVLDDANNDFDTLEAGGRGWGEQWYANAIAFGQVDLDSAMELGVGRFAHNNGRFFVYNDGLNQFGNMYEGGTSWLSGGSYTTSMAFGDVDGDGIDDLGVTRKHYEIGTTSDDDRFFIYKADNNNGEDTEFVLIGEGGGADGNWGSGSLAGGDWGDGYYATSIAFGNVDDDDALEIGITRNAHQKWDIRYWILDDALNNFSTLYEGGADWGDSGVATSIAFGDIDGDGVDEIGITRSHDKDFDKWFIIDDAIAGFEPIYACGGGGVSHCIWGSAADATDIAFGDVDGDGLDEIGVARETGSGSGGDRWFILDDKNGEFELLFTCGDTGASHCHWGNAAYPTSIAFGDVDGDGKDEVGVSRYNTSNSRFFIFDDYLSEGKDGEKASFALIGEGGAKGGLAGGKWGEDAYATEIAFGDTDGDGADEVAISRKYQGKGNHVTYYDKDHPEAFSMVDGLYRYLPIAELGTTAHGTNVAPYWHGWPFYSEWDLNGDAPDGDYALNAMLYEFIDFCGFSYCNGISDLGDVYYMGMVPPSMGWGVLGLAIQGERVSWSKMHDITWPGTPWHHTGASIIAHEIGHNKNRKHVLCLGSEDNVTNLYPYPNPDCRLANLGPAGYYGFDVYHHMFPDTLDEPTVISNDPLADEPHRAFPFMGYRRPVWADPFTYCDMLNKTTLVFIAGEGFALTDVENCDLEEVAP